MSKIPSYGKIYNLGRPEVASIFDGPVLVQEKVDGSQFSFGVLDGELHIRSKNATIDPDNPPAMFRPAVETVLQLGSAGMWPPGVVYRGEAFQSNKHNHLAYDRAPKGNIVLFDVEVGYERKDQASIAIEASCLGIEPVAEHTVESFTLETLEAALDRTSQLGGCKIEGLVFKSLTQTDPRTGQRLMAKLVSPKFREDQRAEWKEKNPNKNDALARIAMRYANEARFRKAAQHLDEQGILEHSPRDISKLMDEVVRDILEEEGDTIREHLLAWAMSKGGMRKRMVGDIPDWYKNLLLERQFDRG